ncbi:MAG TPA: pilin [Candidatus Saccharimonadales bacterium]|nr:pilin [Candidatus Saccharimonadales bacterium]
MFKKINNLILAFAASLVVLVVPAAASARTAPDGSPANPQQTTSSQTSSSNPQKAAATVASAQSDIQCGINVAAGTDCSASSNPSGDLGTTVKKVLNLISAFAGVIAVIMIMVAGFRLITSAGNEESVKKAKSSIVYAVIGLVIIAVAQVIVHFVISTSTSS